MTDAELARRIREHAYLEGDFVLRSGRRSRYYLDKYRFETRPDLLGPLGERTRRLAVAVREATGSVGIFTATNNVVSQSVPHLHVHVVPRNRKDGLRGFFWPRTKYASDEEMASVAAAISAAMVGAVVPYHPRQRAP